jgi:hypothetical protein
VKAKSMSSYNIRQLDLMLDRLTAFDRGAIPFGKLISDLDALLSALENKDEDWTNSFLKQWAILEDIYAYALDKNLKEPPDEDKDLIGKAINELRELIELARAYVGPQSTRPTEHD